MILLWLILILLAGGIFAAIVNTFNKTLTRIVSLASVTLGFIITIFLWIKYPDGLSAINKNEWLEQINWSWIPQFGISFHLALDGISLILITLTMFIGILSVLASWNDIKERIGFFHFNLLWILSGITGVFLALDLFLFYFFWELMLIPMYFLIYLWGHENRVYASFKFFIFTQASGLLMLVSILGLYIIHGRNTGVYTFDYTQLLGTTIDLQTATWLMLGFLIAFIVKLPVVPFHTWLPDAHTEAPTAGSVILAALLLKTGAYGILRFVLPLFPDASMSIAPAAMFFGMLGIIYGAVLAFAQTDLKRLVAYTSVSHMGFVMLGAFAFNELALQGIVMEMVTHGISTGALFIMAGAIQERIHTRDIMLMGRFWEQSPRMGGVALVFVMASLGLPGLGNFIAEFLVLAGAFQANVWITVFATIGLVIATIYSLRIMQLVFYGEKRSTWTFKDFSFREMFIMATLIISIVWLGLYPRTVINTAKPYIDGLMRTFKNEVSENSGAETEKSITTGENNLSNINRK